MSAPSIHDPMPDLTELETLVWQACMEMDKRWPYCYVGHDDILQHTGINPRSLGGIISSLQKKAYLFAWGHNITGDVELSCWARLTFNLTPKKWMRCNNDACPHFMTKRSRSKPVKVKVIDV